MNRIARRAVLLGVAMIGLLALVACGGGKPAVPLVSVSGADYSFDAPGWIAGGLTTLRFTNEGQEAHELQLMRLSDGASIHQFQQALHQDEQDALELVSAEFHVAHIGAGQTAEATLDLREGEYVLICLVTSPDDGVAHAAKGMVKPLTVTAAP